MRRQRQARFLQQQRNRPVCALKIPLPMSKFAAQHSDKKKSHAFPALLLLAFFGPYFPGTPLRLDQVIGWTYIVLVYSQLLFGGSELSAFRRENQIAKWAMLILGVTL